MPQTSNKQIQTQQQQQTMTLSPQQILTVKLLELPTIELEDRVHAELLDNPALEEGHDETADNASDEPDSTAFDGQETDGDTSYNALDDYRNDDDIPDYKLQERNYSRSEQVMEIPFSDTTSFYESLIEQLGEHQLTERQSQLAEYLIGSLDDDGLLRKPIDSLADELAIYQGIDTNLDELQQALLVVQEFDPPGIGARSLQECLLIQIRRKMAHADDATLAVLRVEEQIISRTYDDFTNKRWDRIAQRLGVDEQTFAQAAHEITHLNPRPGASMGEALGKNLQQIVPDFIIDCDDDGNISLSLNAPDLPELRLSRTYTDLLREQSRGARTSREQREALQFVQQKINAAQGFIDALKQRQHTLLTTMQAIIDWQRPFFIEGDESLLRPMILKDVAKKTGLDISTISRVSNSKYAQTNFGIFPLRFFFGDGYINSDGEEMSTREIKQTIRQLIDTEDKSAPLNDDRLTRLLQDKGFPVARRTVAKYREQLAIPVARLRKHHTPRP